MYPCLFKNGQHCCMKIKSNDTVYNSRKYWHKSCKNKGSQLFLTVPTSLALLGLMVNVERVSAILSLRGADSKSTSLKYCRLTCNWADGATHRSYPHMVLLTMQTRTKGFAPSPTRSLSKYGGISARITPTCNLTNLYNYFQRSAYVRSPVSGLALRLSLRCTSDTYSLHMQRISSLKKAHRSR